MYLISIVQLHFPRVLFPFNSTSGSPDLEENHVGIYRQNSLINNLDDAYANVLANGVRPFGEPSRILHTPDGVGVTVFAFRDPDGNTLEMIGHMIQRGRALISA